MDSAGLCRFDYDIAHDSPLPVQHSRMLGMLPLKPEVAIECDPLTVVKDAEADGSHWNRIIHEIAVVINEHIATLMQILEIGLDIAAIQRATAVGADQVVLDRG